MKLTELSIDRRITVFVLLLLIFIMGTWSYNTLPRESNPEIVIPYVTVDVPYEGVSPEDIESLITIPLERKLTSLSGVKEMRSSSVEGLSHIFLEFEPDIDINDALQKVRDKVDLAEPDIPEEADDSSINEINTSEFPIMIMSLSGNLPLAALDKLAEDMEEQIETINGVLDVEIVGGVEREIQIEVDPSRVAEYDISFGDLMGVIAQENVNTPGGSMDLGEAKFTMRTPGEFQNPDDINDLIVKQSPMGSVYLRDIATVRDGFKEIESMSRLNGQPSVTLTVIKRSGSNIIEIADEVNATLAKLYAEMPAGLDIVLTWDESVQIHDMLNELVNSILSGLILVVIVIFIFLGFRNAFLVALAIPVSMLITFSVLAATNVTLNMVVLFSLILALGMLVDNGIVIVENIYRHRQEGKNSIEAAKAGAAEVAWPIASSTMTTVAAFFPMFFWPGIWGEFMFYLPYTLTVALLASLFVGLVVNPALASVFMRSVKPKKISASKKLNPILGLYAGVLKMALRWRMVTITLAFAALILIIGVFFRVSKTEFIPETEPPQAYIDIECPEGTNLATTDTYARAIEKAIEPFAQYMDSIVTNVGSLGVTPDGFSSGGNMTHISRVSLDFPKLEDCEVLPSEVLRRIRDAVPAMSGADISIEKMDMGPPHRPAYQYRNHGR